MTPAVTPATTAGETCAVRPATTAGKTRARRPANPAARMHARIPAASGRAACERAGLRVVAAATIWLAVALLVGVRPVCAFEMLPSAGGRPADDAGLGRGSPLSGPAVKAEGRPEALREVGFDQRPDALVPLDVPFLDESGREVRLRDLLGARPILLQLAYYRCPMLCPIVLGGLTSSLKPLAFDAGREFDVVTVSIDPTETPEQAAERKRDALQRYGRPETADGWHFLTGRPDSIAKLSKAVGFRYAWDEKSQEYAHAAGIVLLTPDGRVSRYFFGAEFSPRDLRLGLVEATEGKVGSVVDQLLLFCFHYDPAMGRYSATALNAVRAGGAVTVLALVSFIAWNLRRDRRPPPPPARGTPVTPQGTPGPSAVGTPASPHVARLAGSAKAIGGAPEPAPLVLRSGRLGPSSLRPGRSGEDHRRSGGESEALSEHRTGASSARVAPEALRLGRSGEAHRRSGGESEALSEHRTGAFSK